jgi:hypothetical protein
MYHPMLGWMQRDPLGYIDGMNVYGYLRNRPTMGSDPFGLTHIPNYSEPIVVLDITDALARSAARFENWCNANPWRAVVGKYTFDASELTMSNCETLYAVRSPDGTYMFYRGSDINYIFQGIAGRCNWEILWELYSQADLNKALRWPPQVRTQGVTDWIDAGYYWQDDGGDLTKRLSGGKAVGSNVIVMPYGGKELTLGGGWDPNNTPMNDKYAPGSPAGSGAGAGSGWGSGYDTYKMKWTRHFG